MAYFERKQEILDFLKINKTATVEQLSEQLYVSPATVRRDLIEMQRLGLIERTHGGAVLVEGSDEISILIRKAKNAKEKDRTVRAALRQCETGGGIVDEHRLKVGQVFERDGSRPQLFPRVLFLADEDGAFVRSLGENGTPVRALGKPQFPHLGEIPPDRRLAHEQRVGKFLHARPPVLFEIA